MRQEWCPRCLMPEPSFSIFPPADWIVPRRLPNNGAGEATEVFPVPPVSSTVLIDKLLSTVIQIKASDLHITTGQPPVVRHQGRMRRLDTKTLESDDTTALMKSITPDRCQQELQEKGGCDFAIEFTDGYRFRVAVFKQRGNIG